MLYTSNTYDAYIVVLFVVLCFELCVKYIITPLPPPTHTHTQQHQHRRKTSTSATRLCNHPHPTPFSFSTARTNFSLFASHSSLSSLSSLFTLSHPPKTTDSRLQDPLRLHQPPVHPAQEQHTPHAGGCWAGPTHPQGTDILLIPAVSGGWFVGWLWVLFWVLLSSVCLGFESVCVIKHCKIRGK